MESIYILFLNKKKLYSLWARLLDIRFSAKESARGMRILLLVAIIKKTAYLVHVVLNLD